MFSAIFSSGANTRTSSCRCAFLADLTPYSEPTKQAVLDAKEMLDQAGITEQRAALCQAASQAFYNTSKFTLRDLKSRASQQQLRQDFEAYLDGFSPNVQDILENFKFRNQISTLSKADALGTLIAKFVDPEVNLSPHPVLNGDGSVKHRAWTIIPWGPSSRNSSAGSMRKTTRKLASTGPPATL